MQNEKRVFVLTYFEKFKYYRITINKNCGCAAYSGFGALELYEATNEYIPMVASIDLSLENSLVINTGLGKSTIGKINSFSQISTAFTLENLYNNTEMYLGFIKNFENRFKPFITTACPVYANKIQKYSNKNSILQ